MSFQTAHAFAFSLATTLMAAIVIFRAGDGTLSVTPAAEYDGDETARRTGSHERRMQRVSAPTTTRILLISQSRHGGGGGASS
ncbi:MAG: hypothetical protein IPK28_07095 [Devosia sp.]|nr:hypothetical protein [Devosia sp.]